MAITPFTQPVEQGSFIPPEPRLPVQEIGQAAQNIYKQDVRQRDRLNQVFNKIAEQNVSPQDRQALKQLEERYRGQMEQMTEDDLLFGDRQRISELARDASKNLSRLEQARQLRQKQVEEIEDTAGMSQSEKEMFKRTLQSRGVQLDEQGNIDPSTLPSVTKIGDQPEEGIYDAFVDASSGLKERMVTGDPQLDPEMGWAEIVEKSGVTWDRIYNSIKNEIGSNPQIANWKDNRTTLEARRLLRTGAVDSRQEALEKAQSRVNDDVDALARNVAENRAHQDLDRSFRNLPEGFGGAGADEDYEGSYSVNLPPMSVDQYPEKSAGRKEAMDRAERIYEAKLGTQFSKAELQTIRDFQREAERRSGNKLRKRDILAVIKPGMDPITERTTEGQLAKLMRENRPELWNRYQSFVNNTKKQASSMEYAPKAYIPRGLTDQDIQDITETLKIAEDNNQIKSQDVKVQTEGGWMPFFGDDQIKDGLDRVLSNSERVGVTDDGRHIVVTTDQSVGPEGDERLENETFRISTNNLDEGVLRGITEQFSPDIRRTINSNIKYREQAITQDNPLSIGDNVQVGKESTINPQNNVYRENYNISVDGRKVTYKDVIPKMKDQPQRVASIIADAARRKNLNSINSPQKVIDAWKDYKSTDPSNNPSTAVKALENVINSSVKYKHRGPAIETAQILNR